MKIEVPKLPAEVARFVWRYDASTGDLIWRVSPGGRAKAGDVAGCASTDKRGYRIVRLFGSRYRIHRLVWLIVNGEWPSDQLDHINGDRTDSRIENLRIATDSQNRMNTGRYRNNTTGYKGVTQTNPGKFGASIAADGRSYWLGTFDSPEAASLAYQIAAIGLHGAYARHESFIAIQDGTLKAAEAASPTAA